MAAMRMTLRSGRYNASPKHNDRTFDLEKSDHIDISRIEDNVYWECASGKTQKGSPVVPFEKAELDYYKRYQGAVDEMNQRALEQRHKDRLKTTKHYHDSKKTMPDEEVYYIGNRKGHAKWEDVWNIYAKYNAWHKENFPQIKYLDIALHMDEATPHIHARKVWEYTNENGNLAVCQKTVLAELGFEREFPEKKETRNNNAKKPYSALCREKMIELCKEKGYELIEEPEKRPANEQNLTRLEYAVRNLEKELEAKSKENQALSQENQKCRNEIEQLKSEKTALAEKIQQLYKQTLTLQDDVSKLESNKDFIEMKFRGFVAEMDYMMKNMHEMSDIEIQRRSETFIQQYNDIRDEIDLEMD